MNWHNKGIFKAHKHFHDQMNKEERAYTTNGNQKTNHCEAMVFLNRNKRRSTLKSLARTEVRVVNRISYKVGWRDQTHPNQLKLVPAVHSKEDLLFRYNNKRDDQQYLRCSLKRVLEFRVGLAYLEMALV